MAKSAKKKAVPKLEKTAEELQLLTPDQVIPVQAPIFNASMANLQGTGTEILLTFARARPAHTIDGKQQNIAMGEPVAIISMSPGMLKDLALMIDDVIVSHEKQFGIVNTPYTIKRSVTSKPRSKRVH